MVWTVDGCTTDADIISIARIEWPRWKPLLCIAWPAGGASGNAGLEPASAPAAKTNASAMFIATSPCLDDLA
jgi:hypothetical protein